MCTWKLRNLDVKILAWTPPQAKFVCKGVLGSLNFDVICGRVCCGEGVWLVARLVQSLNLHETTYCSTMLLYLDNGLGLRTIVLLLHCRS
jgi:hypothetical protein